MTNNVPDKQENDVVKGLMDEKSIMVKGKIYLEDIKVIFKKALRWIGFILALSGCCPHYFKCVP